MAKIDIFMPWYLGDYLNKTQHLQTPQHGALLLLLAHHWAKGGVPLPDDLDSLIQVTRMRFFCVDASSITKASLSQASSIDKGSTNQELMYLRAWMLDLLNEFFVRQPDGTWQNVRGAAEYQKWAIKQENLHIRAKAGAAGRWGKDYIPKRKRTPSDGHASSIPQAQLRQSPLPSPSKNKSKYQRSFAPGSDRSGGRASSKPSSPAPGKTPPRSAPSAATKSASPGKRAQSPAKRLALVRGAKKSASAASPPRKSIATDVRSASNPRKQTKPPDRRFAPFQAEISKYWKSAHKREINQGLTPADPPWGPRERREMSSFLVSNRALTLPMFVAVLANRAGSEVVHSEPPYKWIKDLMMYSRGRLNRFKQPL